MKAERRAELNPDNDELAGGILRSHHVAVGMTKNEQELFCIAWLRKRFPADVEKLGRLDRPSGTSSEPSLFLLPTQRRWLRA
jgi:hypothetical protein